MHHCHDCHRIGELHDKLLIEASELERIAKEVSYGRIMMAVEALELKAKQLRKLHLTITGRE